MRTCALVGAVDFNADDFLRRDFDYVIAVDGGFAHLEAIGVKPDVVMGDFDSLGYVPRFPRIARFPKEKDKSDMELALERAMARHADEIYVYGGLSARLDHTVANLQLFARFSEKGPYITGVGDDFAVRVLTGPDVFELPDGLEEGTVSVFAANDRVRGVIESGMKYSLDDVELTNRTSLGLSNELQGKPARVGAEEGTLYVFYPLPAKGAASGLAEDASASCPADGASAAGPAEAASGSEPAEARPAQARPAEARPAES